MFKKNLIILNDIKIKNIFYIYIDSLYKYKYEDILTVYINN